MALNAPTSLVRATVAQRRCMTPLSPCCRMEDFNSSQYLTARGPLLGGLTASITLDISSKYTWRLATQHLGSQISSIVTLIVIEDSRNSNQQILWKMGSNGSRLEECIGNSSSNVNVEVLNPQVACSSYLVKTCQIQAWL